MFCGVAGKEVVKYEIVRECEEGREEMKTSEAGGGNHELSNIEKKEKKEGKD